MRAAVACSRARTRANQVCGREENGAGPGDATDRRRYGYSNDPPIGSLAGRRYFGPAGGGCGCYRVMVPIPRRYTTEAIVLSRFDFGEADRILTLITPAWGKIKVIAKGFRRPTSRIGGSLEPLPSSRWRRPGGVRSRS